MSHRFRAFASLCVALAVGSITGCNGNNPPASGPLPTPVFTLLEIPDPNGAPVWQPIATIVPAPNVLPTFGRGVRVSFSAPVGSSFSVSLRALDGTLTPLPENQGAPAPPEAGYFQVMSVNASATPPVYRMYVRAPMALADPANYDVEIVNRSLRTDVTDSSPLVVALRQRPVFTVTVMVQGDGHVTSTPPGIQCGRSPGGSTLAPCSANFGPGPVSLQPNSNDPNTTKFIGWSGNCAPNVQVCTFALIGLSAISATATFGPSTTTVPVSACPAAAAIPGLRWTDVPQCDITHTGIGLRCDAQGFFCCEPAPMNANAPRCGGQGQLETSPNCQHLAPRGLLRPGGCYEVDSGP